jgi:predicted nucleic-acid-binding protein
MADAVLDTSVLVRYLTEDDLQKTQAVGNMLRSAGDDSFLLPDVALAELAFVLSRVYRWQRVDTARAIRAVVNHRAIVVVARDTWLDVADDVDQGRGIVDSYLLRTAQREGIPQVTTFDEKIEPVHGVELVAP